MAAGENHAAPATEHHRVAQGQAAGSPAAPNRPPRMDLKSNRFSADAKSGPEKFVRRVSGTETTDKPFDRAMSSREGSLGSLQSVKTRVSHVSRSTYHEDLKPDLSTHLTWQVILAVFTIVFGCSFLFGYNIGVLNQPEQLIKDFYNETYTKRGINVESEFIEFFYALTTSLFIPGGIAGAFAGGYLADKVGRKRAIIMSELFVVIGSVLCVLCQVVESPELLMLGRVFLGFQSGMGNCIAPMYLQEIAPYTYKGAFGTTHQLFVTLGIFVSSVLGVEQILGTATLWPVLLLVMALPAIFALCVLPFLADSPRYLLLIEKDRKSAEKALQFYRNQRNVNADMEEMDTEHIHRTSQDIYTVKDLLQDKALLLPLMIACMLQVIQQFSGINAIFLYSNSVFEDANVPEDQIPFAIIGTNGVNVFMTIISVMLMDRAGRRPLLLIPMAVMIVDLIIITVSLNMQDQYSWMAYISVICVIIYVICFAIGLGPIPMMVASEIFRQGPRPAAMTVAGCVNWISTFAIAIGFKNVQEKTGPYVFIIFLILMICFIAFVYFQIPETKNKTFEEIAHQFSPGDNIEVEEAVDELFGMPSSPPVFPEAGVDPSDAKLVTLNFPHVPSPTEEPDQMELLPRTGKFYAKGSED